jgi:hypothetical protein
VLYNYDTFSLIEISCESLRGWVLKAILTFSSHHVFCTTNKTWTSLKVKLMIIIKGDSRGGTTNSASEISLVLFSITSWWVHWLWEPTQSHLSSHILNSFQSEFKVWYVFLTFKVFGIFLIHDLNMCNS